MKKLTILGWAAIIIAVAILVSSLGLAGSLSGIKDKIVTGQKVTCEATIGARLVGDSLYFSGSPACQKVDTCVPIKAASIFGIFDTDGTLQLVKDGKVISKIDISEQSTLHSDDYTINACLDGADVSAKLQLTNVNGGVTDERIVSIAK